MEQILDIRWASGTMVFVNEEKAYFKVISDHVSSEVIQRRQTEKPPLALPSITISCENMLVEDLTPDLGALKVKYLHVDSHMSKTTWCLPEAHDVSGASSAADEVHVSFGDEEEDEGEFFDAEESDASNARHEPPLLLMPR
eukprot:evm.model.NODE_4642_length_71726_cov_21.816496.1